jgi:fibronectin-binding autotransporter adhesin
MHRIIQQLAATALSCVLPMVLLLVPATSALAANKFWKNSVVTGSWSTGTNWSATSATGVDNAGAPIGNDTVNIRPTDGANHTVTYDVGSSLTLTQLIVDLTGGPGATTTTFSMSMSTNDLTSSNEWIGNNGRGTFNHSAGKNTIAAGTGFLDVGVFGGSTGTYNLSGTGALVANTNEYVGDVGMGVFNQTGGTNTINGFNVLYLGYNAIGTGGTYNLSAGDLSLLNSDEYIGYNVSGTFNQSGGTNTVRTLSLGVGGTSAKGTYTLSGGTLSCNETELIGSGGMGIFNQTGGTNIADNLTVGDLASANGTYNLGGTGSLTTTTQYIGYGGNGTMSQTGGTNTVTGDLFIGLTTGIAGTYTLSAGVASVNSGTYLGGTSGSTGGSGGAGVLTVSGTGVLNAGSVLKVNNRAGTSLNLSGGTINTAALNFGGVPARFNWTSGKLNVTSNVTWDSAAAGTTTSAAFGPALVLGSDQTLMITGNETVGGTGAFGLTLNSGSTHYVTGDITLRPTGTITQNLGGALTYSTFTQVGGAFNGTLQNQGKFIYHSGQFNGQMVNHSGAYLVVAGEFSASNLVNDGDMVVINTSIGGPVVNNNAVTVVGSVDFNGPVSGPGDFFGPGTAHFNGGIAPGASPAEVSFEGSLALADTNTLFIEIGGITPGSQYDRLTIAGSASIDGILNVSLINGFTPSGGQQFTILTAGSIVDNGFVLAGPAASSFSMLVNGSNVILQAIGLAGDYNQNGIVDAADYVVWRKGLGTTYTPNDYNVWRANFGATIGSGSGAGSSANVPVPEPAVMVLLLMGALTILIRRGTK